MWKKHLLWSVASLIAAVSAIGCDDATVAARRHHPAVRAKIKCWNKVDDFPTRLAQFETVFWEPEDTRSLRELIAHSYSLEGKTVLEIGTGTGLIALCCLEAGAKNVVATDVNQNAITNAKFNARTLGLEERLETRQVPLDDSGAFAVIDDSEKFDLIISNPPWEDAAPKKIDDYAFYDPSFKLLDSLLRGLQSHLNPGGKALLAYGCVTAIRTTHELAERYGLDVVIVDQRDPDTLPEVFLPGMLLELKLNEPQ